MRIRFITLAVVVCLALGAPKLVASKAFAKDAPKLHATAKKSASYGAVSAATGIAAWKLPGVTRRSSTTSNTRLGLSSQQLVHKLGLLPSSSKPGLYRGRQAPASLFAPRTLSAAVDNSAGLPPVGDQGIQGSCVAWTLAYYYKTYQERQEFNWDVRDAAHQFSPAFLYNQYAPFDEGSTFDEAFNRLLDQGCATLVEAPYNENDHTTWPSYNAFRVAIPHRIASYTRLGDGATAGIVDTMKAHLAGGDLVAVGFPIYRPSLNAPGHFDALNSNYYFYAGPASADVVNAGGHAVAVVGYDDSAFGGQGGFKIVNQWGTEWGNHGFAYLSYQFVRDAAFDIYVMADRLGYQPSATAHFKLAHTFWGFNYDDVTVTIGAGSQSNPLWSKVVLTHLEQSSLTVDMAVDISEGAAQLPPSLTQPWWLKVDDSAVEDVGVLSIFEIDSGATNYSASVVLPLTGPYFKGSFSAYIPSGTAASNNYYVNDDSTVGDQYCTVAGDDSNDGLTPATPKRNVQALVDLYTLKAGDTVFIDSGTYTLASDIHLTQLDRGGAGNPLCFKGALGANGEPLTIFNRGGGSGSSFLLDGGTRLVQLENMWLQGGTYGVNFDGAWALNDDDGELTLQTVRISNCSGDALELNMAGSVAVRNCRLHNFGGPYGIHAHYSSITVEQSVVTAGPGKICVRAYSDGGYYTRGSAITLSNSILTATGSNAKCAEAYSSWSSFNPTRYCDLFASNGALLGVSLDSTNLTTDPLFADAANGDFHLQSSAGRWNPAANAGVGAFTNDTANSPCIDAGDPTFAVGLESAPNGGRLNIGAYGGTAFASKSPSVRVITVTSPNGGESWAGVHNVTWDVRGGGWATNETVKLEFWDGAIWQLLDSSSASVPYRAGAYPWNVSATGIPSGSSFKVRVSANANPAAFDESDGTFTVLNYIRYYVNDASTANDVYCTAVGNDVNDGLSPATPKATLQAILDAYNLEPGDTVYVDTGTYALTANVLISALDGGSSSAVVRFLGSPKGTVLNRQSTSNTACLEVHGDYVWIEGFTCTGSGVGISLNVDTCHNATLHRNIIHDTALGLESRSYSSGYGQKYTFTNNLLYNNSVGMILSGYGSSTSENYYVANNTIVGSGDGIRLYAGSTSLANNIISMSGAFHYCIYSAGGVIGASDYNDFLTAGGAQVARTYTGAFIYDSTLLEWQNRTGRDSHSLSVDPLFADSANGDFHLKSTGGRWNPATDAFVNDAVDSPCVDAGNPADLVGQEVAPNGARINMGAYGGTAQASKSAIGRSLRLLQPNGGEAWSGTRIIRWNATGQAWAANNTIKLESSNDSGSTWNAIVGASALPFAASEFAWDTTTVASGTKYRVRVTCNQQPVRQDTSDANFTIHNAALIYYVNDASTSNDVYCTAVGNDVNDGLSPATPKATLQAILDAYNLEPGDTVYVDTGTYALTANVLISALDGGSSSAVVRFLGSPKGTVLNRQSTSNTACLEVHGDYVWIEGFTCTGSGVGISLNVDTCHNATLHRNIIHDTALGLESRSYSSGYGQKYTFTNNLLYNNSVGMSLSGYGSSTSENYYVANNTIVGSGDGIKLYAGSTSLANNIISVSGASHYCIYGGAIAASDYNDFLTAGGAKVARTYSGAFIDDSTLLEWQNRTGRDSHSLSVDPLFADSANGDFHLKSTGGRWNPATDAFVADALDSPCVDTGNPADLIGDEVAPNGARINMGAYGGTAFASKSRLSRRLVLLAPNGGEVWQATRTIRWDTTGQGWIAGDLVTIEYSADGGGTWQGLETTGVPFQWGQLVWDTTTVPDGTQYRVRVALKSAPGTNAASAANFEIKNGVPLSWLSVSDVLVTEGNSGTKNATFTVTLNPANNQTVTVDFATADGTTFPATAGSDYTATNGTLSFGVGESTKTVIVPILGDTLDEENETFLVNLTNPTNAAISDAQGLGSITDDDAVPSLAINDISVNEGDAGTSDATFNVTLSKASGRVVTVQWKTVNGATNPATADVDFTSVPLTTLTFNPGETSKTVTVPVINDLLNEFTESFRVQLSSAVNAKIGDTSGLCNILDNDPLPSFSINDVTISEGNALVDASFTVTLSVPSGKAVSVQYKTVEAGSPQATAGVDYTPVPLTTLTFSPGTTSKTVKVTILPDTIAELSEQFEVVLSSSSYAAIADGIGLGTITDNDPTPTINVSDATVTEGNTGTVLLNYTVSLSNPSSRNIGVKYQTANSATLPATAGTDYVARGLTNLSFLAGETTKTVSVTVNGDVLDEDNEHVALVLSGPSNAVIGDGTGEGIINDDDALPNLVIGDASVSEGNSGTKTLAFTVTLDAPSGRTVSVDYKTVNGGSPQATAGVDYVAAVLTTVTFTPGQTSKTITITINGDTAVESNEQFQVSLSNRVNCTIADGVGLGTILNDDVSALIFPEDEPSSEQGHS